MKALELFLKAHGGDASLHNTSRFRTLRKRQRDKVFEEDGSERTIERTPVQMKILEYQTETFGGN